MSGLWGWVHFRVSPPPRLSCPWGWGVPARLGGGSPQGWGAPRLRARCGCPLLVLALPESGRWPHPAHAKDAKPQPRLALGRGRAPSIPSMCPG